MKKVSKRQAEAAAKAIGRAFGADEAGDYAPVVQEREDRPGYYVVAWEGGSYEWPFLMDGGVDEELVSMLYPEFEQDLAKAVKRSTRQPVKLPKGVAAEAMNHYSVALYSEEEY